MGMEVGGMVNREGGRRVSGERGGQVGREL